jgi:hypothetical protein
MKLARQLSEDRAMRDAALILFKSDLELIRQDLKHRGLGTRLADRMGEGAADMMEDAVGYASENRGKIAAIVLSAALWFARRPILRFLGKEPDEDLETEDALTSSEEGMTTSPGDSNCEQRET